MVCRYNAKYVDHSYKNDFNKGQPSKQQGDIIRKDTKLPLLRGKREYKMEILCRQMYAKKP